ncbi:MAG: glycosyltransferase [Fimbriimonadaceae bacterium]|nr:glycosyltransferase [Chthonomonadaceae bacterium]MCO5297694.1 glycosyltransferase [Fimbriimonadaceae bacterium]
MVAPRNVVILSDFAHVAGGAEKVALVSARALARRGHEVVLFSAIGPIAEELKGVPGLTVHCLEQQPFFKSSGRLRAAAKVFWNAEARAALGAVLETLDPAQSLVHAHSYLKLLSSSTLDLALKRGFRCALTLHDYGIACPQQNFYDHSSGTICHRKPLGWACTTTQCTPRSYPVKAGLLLRGWIQQRLARLPARLDAYLSVSEFSHDVLRPYLPASTPVIPVRNPVELERGERVAAEANARFTFVGRLTTEKSPELLAKAATLAGASALFVGDGEQRAAIETACPGAEITGWIPSEDVAGHTRSARAVCVTSKWYEAAPLVVFDALSQGIPLVVSDACAAQEFVEEGVTGLLFRSGDAEHLADRLRTLQDDSLVERMSRAAYDRFWADPPTVDAHIDELLAAYAQIMARAK